MILLGLRLLSDAGVFCQFGFPPKKCLCPLSLRRIEIFAGSILPLEQLILAQKIYKLVII
jgi:hypothetical protein